MQKLYEELVHYRTEYISAAERLCAYRNVSKLADVGSCLCVHCRAHHTYQMTRPPHTLYTPHTHKKATFVSLAVDCYTAQKTYRLVLSKYVLSLRQAHTQDMVRQCDLIYIVRYCDLKLTLCCRTFELAVNSMLLVGLPYKSLSLVLFQISLVRRVIEHILSLYSYCNFSAQVGYFFIWNIRLSIKYCTSDNLSLLAA